jgi:hypothetical protein
MAEDSPADEKLEVENADSKSSWQNAGAMSGPVEGLLHRSIAPDYFF